MDPVTVETEALARLGSIYPTPETTEALDEAVQALIQTLSSIAEATVPLAKPGGSRPVYRWWSSRTAQASIEAKRAQRRYRRKRSPAAEDDLRQALYNRQSVFRRERAFAWRTTLGEATTDLRLLWNLERWARLRSFNPPDSLKTPPLFPDSGNPEQDRPAETRAEKEALFSERFFPAPIADPPPSPLSPSLQGGRTNPVPLSQDVSEDDIYRAMRAKPWRAPGVDGLPLGFLKACGQPFRTAILALTRASLALSYFPQVF